MALKQSPLSDYMGALPLIQSLVTASLLLYLLKVVEPAPPRDVGRLALVAAVALGFATTAIPLQLENEWLTIAWALEAAAVAWLYQRLRHTGLIAASLALSAVITVRLVANPEVLLYHVRSSTPLLNFYLYTYLASALALYLAGFYLSKPSETRFVFLNKTSTLQRVFGTLLLFVLVNVEIADFFSEGESITFRFSSTLTRILPIRSLGPCLPSECSWRVSGSRSGSAHFCTIAVNGDNRQMLPPRPSGDSEGFTALGRSLALPYASRSLQFCFNGSCCELQFPRISHKPKMAASVGIGVRFGDCCERAQTPRAAVPSQ